MDKAVDHDPRTGRIIEYVAALEVTTIIRLAAHCQGRQGNVQPLQATQISIWNEGITDGDMRWVDQLDLWGWQILPHDLSQLANGKTELPTIWFNLYFGKTQINKRAHILLRQCK